MRSLLTLRDCKGTLLYLSHNDLMSKLLRINNPSLDTINQGFDIFNLWTTPNWIKFYLIYLNFIIDAKQKLIDIPKELFTFYDCYDKEIKGELKLIKSQFIESYNLITDIYFVFDYQEDHLMKFYDNI